MSGMKEMLNQCPHTLHLICGFSIAATGVCHSVRCLAIPLRQYLPGLCQMLICGDWCLFGALRSPSLRQYLPGLCHLRLWRLVLSFGALPFAFARIFRTVALIVFFASIFGRNGDGLQ
jgi:hypothetical protein